MPISEHNTLIRDTGRICPAAGPIYNKTMKRISQFKVAKFLAREKSQAMEVYNLSESQYEMVLTFINNNGLSEGATIFVDQAPDGKVYLSSGGGTQSSGATGPTSNKTPHAPGDYVSTSMKPGSTPEVSGSTSDKTLAKIVSIIGIVSGTLYVIWQAISLVFTIQDRKEARRQKQSNNDDHASN